MNVKSLRLLFVLLMLVIFASALEDAAQAGGYAPTSVSVSTDGPSVATHTIKVYTRVSHSAKPALTGQVCINVLRPNSTSNFNWSCLPVDGSGKATFTTEHLDTGDFVIQARYMGDLLYQQSATASVTQHVVPIQTKLTFDNPNGLGGYVALSPSHKMTYVLISGINDTIQTFPGKVVLVENGQTIATADTEPTADGWRSIAYFRLGQNLNLSPGTHYLTASYVRNSTNFTNSASNSVKVVVMP